MMESLRREIITTLMEPDIRRLSVIMKDLIYKNNSLKGTKYLAMRYMGTPLPERIKGIRLTDHPEVHPTLIDQLDKWNKDAERIRQDQQYFQQTFINLLGPCKKNIDVRDALPDCVVSLVPCLNCYTRTREEAWTIKHDQKLYQQYLNSTQPKLMSYASLRFFF
jgi:hypothetical protein